MNTLDDSGDNRSRLFRIIIGVLVWLGVVIPLGMAFDKVTAVQVGPFLQWMLPIIIGLFGGIKSGQKIAGVLKAKKE